MNFKTIKLTIKGMTCSGCSSHIEKEIPYEVSKLDLKHVPRALAAQDTRGFIKLIRNTETDKLIGARIVALEGGGLI